MNRKADRLLRALLGCALMFLLGAGAWGKDPPPPKSPPPPPPVRNVPIDLELQKAARQEVAAELRSNDWKLRDHAVETLRQAPSPQGDVLLLRALHDPDAPVRFAALMACGELRLIDARDPALQMLDDPDAGVRAAARLALHRTGDTRFTHDLEKMSRDPNATTRGETAMVLGRLGERSALRVLHAMEKDNDPTVRQQVAEAMWRLGDDSALEPLLADTLSTHPDDQMNALIALASAHDKRLIPDIRSHLTDDYLEVALVAARALGDLGSDDGYAIAEQGARSDDARQRYLAAIAFGAIGRADAQEFLARLLKDKDGEVRAAAAMAILQIGKGK